MKLSQIALLTIIVCALIAVINPGGRRTREPDCWNEMAQAYLEEGLPERAIQCYEECIAEGSANSAVYYNFGDLLLLSRHEAAAYYNADIQLIFDRAFHLFEMALEADPYNFEMAVDIASSHHLVQPRRQEEAILAWEQALSLARTEDECDEAGLHLARAQVAAGLYTRALETLARVRSPGFAELKRILTVRIGHQMAAFMRETSLLRQTQVLAGTPHGIGSSSGVSAMALAAEPTSCEMAAAIARGHDLIQPWHWKQVIRAWEAALRLATTEDERDYVQVNLARAQFKAGLNDEALKSLAQVQSPGYAGFARILISRIQPQI